ncbi:glycoside hydrolase family 95 protein [Niabella terrae]
MWYDRPADATVADSKNGWQSDPEWLKALPVGNGFLGAMVFGDVNLERIQLNEKSLWSGSPDNNNNPETGQYLDSIRQLLFKSDYRQANTLIDRYMICRGVGSGNGNGAKVPYGCYQTLGDLWLDFANKKPYTQYRKELDLDRSLVTVSYIQNGTHYKREIFASYPDRVLVIRLTADKKGALSFKVGLNRPERYQTVTRDQQLIMTGSLPDGKGGTGLSYAACLNAQNTGGKLYYEQDQLVVENADAITLLVTAATNYKLEYPKYRGLPAIATAQQQLRQAASRTYQQLLSGHQRDYQALFNKVQLHLSKGTSDNYPTDQLLKQPGNLHLQELYFQYGRYLLIASSRKGSLPANLQGLWANKIQTPWNADYHANINIQMNYWPAGVTNLSECFSPLTDLMLSLMKPGTLSATQQFQADGWCMGPITNVWGYTAPGEGAGWGVYVTGGGWLGQQLFDQYNFTRDRKYLNRIYPLLQQAARFYLDWLVPDPRTGKLVSGPATSPENAFTAPDGFVGSMSMGPSHDQQIITEFLQVVVKAANILGQPSGLIDSIQKILPNIAQPGIAPDGRLMEWQENFKEREPAHRHVSHLYSLYPGHAISPAKTPELAQAARKSLQGRGDGGTGWSLAWKINFWARLQDGNHAYLLLKNLLSPTNALKVQMSNQGGTYENLFCGHPPFQIDGNFGGTAGIAEMLLQSHTSQIALLPALPDAWAEGAVSGLVARGGHILDMKWEGGKLMQAGLKAGESGMLRIRTSTPIELKGAATKSITTEQGYVLEFHAEKGKNYQFRSPL